MDDARSSLRVKEAVTERLERCQGTEMKIYEDLN